MEISPSKRCSTLERKYTNFVGVVAHFLARKVLIPVLVKSCHGILLLLLPQVVMKSFSPCVLYNIMISFLESRLVSTYSSASLSGPERTKKWVGYPCIHEWTPWIPCVRENSHTQAYKVDDIITMKNYFVWCMCEYKKLFVLLSLQPQLNVQDTFLFL